MSNDCLKVMLDDQTEPQLVPKLLLQVPVRELHNRLVSDTNDVGLKYYRYEYDNIIISDSTLCSLLPPQLIQMSAQYKVMCGCECCITTRSIYSTFLSWHDRLSEKLKDKSQNSQSRRSGEKSHHIYNTYKTQWCHMGVIFFPKHLIWKMLQCAHILGLIMHFYTGNMYFGVVLNFHLSIFLTNK